MFDALVAPGAPIYVDSSPVQRAGIACIVMVDSQPHLLTCGHVFQPGALETEVYARDSETRIAILVTNLLERDSPLDVAICALTDKGMKELEENSGSPTWMGEIRVPTDGLEGRIATFWPTFDENQMPVQTRISSIASPGEGLVADWWGSLGPGPFIRTTGVTEHGDSGSLLSLDGEYLGVCTGRVEDSFFTPLHLAIDALEESLEQEVKLWQAE